ncbi:MAG: hypothetical protein QOI63_1115 [Thermoplasmata archaeon]|nr:hypothetical protein [Thermoplasmata archaeon]
MRPALLLIASLALATFAAVPAHADTCENTPGCGTAMGVVEDCLGQAPNSPCTRAAQLPGQVVDAAQGCLDGSTPACRTADDCLSGDNALCNTVEGVPGIVIKAATDCVTGATATCRTVEQAPGDCVSRANPACKQALSCLDQPTPWFAYGSLCYTYSRLVADCALASPNSVCYGYTSCVYEIHQTPCKLNWLP